MSDTRAGGEWNAPSAEGSHGPEERPERSLRRLLEDAAAHLVDGAMGTVLYDRGVFVNVCYDALVLDQPELVEGIHREYVDAGAEILETNTFGANPVKLSAHGLSRPKPSIARRRDSPAPQRETRPTSWAPWGLWASDSNRGAPRRWRKRRSSSGARCRRSWREARTA